MTTVVDLGKLRFYWAGTYSNTTEYELNDVVRYGGNVYAYTNVVRSVGNLPTDTDYWALMVEGINFIGEWNAATQYFVGDGVAYGSTVFVALEDNLDKRPDLFPALWSQFAEGIQWEGDYSAAATYQKNDVVKYGGSAFIAKQTTSNNLPTDATYWDQFVTGISPEGVYNNATAYVPNDIVAYGANLYIAKANTTGNLPTDTAFWDVFVDSIRPRGDWTTSTAYGLNDIVVRGGNTYQCIVPHNSSVFSTDLAAGRWESFNGGIRWRGEWATGQEYLVSDTIRSVGSTYIAVEDHTSDNFNTDLAAGKWQFFGGDAALPLLGAPGTSLTVDSTGADIAWLGATASQNVFYVTPEGSDSNPGTNLAAAFASIKHAVTAIPTGESGTIFVKTGEYEEAQLPIVVPPNVAIIGDSLRTTIIRPAAGLAADGVTPNNHATMWLLSDGSILQKMSFKGMTGWVPGTTADDITTSTPKAIVVAFNPASPILVKSPYVMECSAIGSGLLAAYLDGTVHATGNRSMVFHAFTVITDNGVGFWVAAGARAEVVSCFTYFAQFGYAASGGGVIRALNGNNSYGTFGSSSRGFDASEVPVEGTLYGIQLQTTSDPINVGFAPGATVTGQTSGATATITNLQAAAGKVYVKYSVGSAEFQPGETINDGVGNTLVIAADGVTGQKGVLLVADGFSEAPRSGASLQIAGDSFSYVIQTVSGTYVDASSIMVITLAQEKPDPSPDGAAVDLRYRYSQIRLTGHDFLNIGTGGVTTTNYPNEPLQPPAQGNEVQEIFPGRVYYVSTDQDGNFRVGEYFRVDQGTGRATLNASAFDLSGLTSLRLGSIGAQLGETINEFSSDILLGGANPKNSAVPTQAATKTYVDTALANVGAVWTIKTANYTAVNNDYLFCDTSAGSFTITLPATPDVNDTVSIADLAGTFQAANLFVARNGERIMGFTEDLVLDQSNVSIGLVYSGATHGWRIV